MYAFAPSLMCMRLEEFRHQIEFLNSVADFFHVDIMDGHYVPNLTLSPFFIENVKMIATKPIDAHLMVEKPEQIAPLCLDAGANYISIHPETVNAKAFRLIDQVQSKGAKFGIVLNPETDPDLALYYLDSVEKITVMTVDPGFSGQKFIYPMLRKIEALRNLKEKSGYKFLIEIDGSCNKKTFHDLAHAGAEAFVVGTSGLFGLDSDIEKAWAKMKEDFYSALQNI
jgi:D-allulose-6-phosphate 3-epimerase